MSAHDALAACGAIEATLVHCAGPTSGEIPTLKAWVETFLALRPRLDPKSADLYRACGRRLAGFWGADTAIDKVTALDAMRFKAALGGDGSTLGEYTAFRICSEARAMFQQAVDGEILAKNPFRKAMPAKPTPDRTWAYIGLDVLERLLAACPSRSPWRVCLGLLRLAGLRQHEALGLEWANINLAAKRITVASGRRYQTTKRRTRQLPIGPRLAELLFEASMEQGQDQRVLAGLHAGSLWRGFRAICKRASIEPHDRWAHTLRKACQTDWSGQHPIHVVAEWLGNSPQVAMAHYLKAKPEDFENASISSSTGAGTSHMPCAPLH